MGEGEIKKALVLMNQPINQKLADQRFFDSAKSLKKR